MANVHGTNLDAALVAVPGAAAIKQAIGEEAAAIAGIDADTKVLLWSVDGGTARVLFGGNTPTATDGHLLADGAGGSWSADAARSAKLILASGTPVLHGSCME
jgi:hypothetical protein